jgi:signal transduction histidine kinase/ligand-binding sensor domain-containing protein
LVKKINFPIIIIWLLILISNEYSQPKVISSLGKGDNLKNYVLSTWNSKNGLPQNSVMAVQQDKNGFLWLATYDGLVRFDGTNFKLYSVKDYPELKSNRLITIYLDSKNTIWISNELGRILTFDGKVFKDLTDEFKTRFLYVFNIVGDSNGTVYLRSTEKLLTYSNGKASYVKFGNSTPAASDYVYSISKMANDTMLVFRQGFVHKILRGKIVETLDFGNISVFNAIWTEDGYYYNENFHLFFSKTFKGLKHAQRLNAPERRVNLFYFGKKMYATTLGKGIYEIMPTGSKRILSKEEVPFKINCIFKDKEDNLWIGTGVNGLMILRTKFLYTLNKSFGIVEPNTYPILRASDNTIWIGQNYGLQRIVGNKILSYTDKYGFYNNSVWGLAEDKEKNIWVAVNGGSLFRFNGKYFEDLGDSIKKEASTLLFSLFNDSKNRMWIGSVDCITKYENKKYFFYHPSSHQKNIFRNFLEDENGTIWTASDQGVLKYTGTNFELQKEFDTKMARALYIDKKKRLWVGTYGNGIIIKDNGKIYKLYKNNGLFSDIVSAIVEDGAGNFWFTSNSGIFRIKETSIDKYLKGEQQFVTSINYGYEEGLENTEFNGGCQPNWMRDKENNLWFPSFAGPVILQTSALRESSFQSKIFIENLTVGSKVFYPDEEIVLPSDYSRFTINFNAPAFSSSNNVQFRYKLSGIDEDWVDIGNQRSITFQKLPYGNYEFELLASDNKGNLSSKPSVIKFSVKGKVYETPFFYMFLLLVLLSGVAYLFNLRLKLGKKREEKLEKIVIERTQSLKLAKDDAENLALEEKTLRSKTEEEVRQKNELLRIVSHDLKNPVSAIIGFAEILLEDGNLNYEDKEIVVMMQDASERLRELISQLLNYSRFDGENFSIHKSGIIVREDVEKIVKRFEIQAGKKEQRIIRNYSGDHAMINVDGLLFSQIMENLLSNAIKYSPYKKDINVWIREENAKMLIGVKDNGQGFSEKDKKNMYKPFVKLSSQPTGGELSSGLGLTIVKKFVELNEGTLELTSEKGAGSEFIISFDKVIN